MTIDEVRYLIAAGRSNLSDHTKIALSDPDRSWNQAGEHTIVTEYNGLTFTVMARSNDLLTIQIGDEGGAGACLHVQRDIAA